MEDLFPYFWYHLELCLKQTLIVNAHSGCRLDINYSLFYLYAFCVCCFSYWVKDQVVCHFQTFLSRLNIFLLPRSNNWITWAKEITDSDRCSGRLAAVIEFCVLLMSRGALLAWRMNIEVYCFNKYEPHQSKCTFPQYNQIPSGFQTYLFLSESESENLLSLSGQRNYLQSIWHKCKFR